MDSKVLEIFDALDSLTDHQVGAIRYLFTGKTGIKTCVEDYLPRYTALFGYQGMLMEQRELHEIAKEEKPQHEL